MPVGPEGLASYSFSIRPEQSLEEAQHKKQDSCVSSSFWLSTDTLLLKPLDTFNYYRLNRRTGPSTTVPDYPHGPNKHLASIIPRRLAQAVGGRKEKEG